MSKSLSLISALLCTFIWGTTFIAQDTGMDKIGPLTFNGARFFIGFLSIIPFALIYENSKIIKQINNNRNEFFKLLFWIGLFLFLGTFVQQAALLYTDIANAAFFTVFYVPMVPIILYIFYKKKIHWSIWPSAILCVGGVYLLSDFSNATVRFGDSLVILCAFFWALHIIFIGKFIKIFDIPLFFTVFYVPMVPIILYIFYKKKIHWSIWPSAILCVGGVYLLSDFSNATVRFGDSLVILCAFFWALHIIFIGKFIKIFDIPLFFGALQALVVASFSFLFGFFFENISFANILNESVSIIYAGVLSGGIAFTLQIYAQKNIAPSPSAIIFSLESVFAAIAAWIILNQYLEIDNIIGCTFILAGVIFSQILPEVKKTNNR